MKKKSLVMTVAALAAFTSIASAAPATSWEQGQWQVDLGASDPKAKFDGLESDTKWNLMVVLATPFLINGPCVMIIMG